jgi:hypothetical protein
LSPVPIDGIERVVRELPGIVIEQDMFISQLSLKLAKGSNIKAFNKHSIDFRCRFEVPASHCSVFERHYCIVCHFD